MLQGNAYKFNLWKAITPKKNPFKKAKHYKVPWINLIRNTQELYGEIFKALIKEIKDGLNT